jgi:hypothetical protein
VESSQVRFLLKYMIVSVNEIWVVIVGGGTGTGVADVRTDVLGSASDGGSASGNVQTERTNEADAEVTYPDLHNSSALHQVGCLKEKRLWQWNDNPAHRLGVRSPLHNQTLTGESG